MLQLTYFDTRGRVEPARLILELAHEPYEYRAVSVAQWRTEGKAKALHRTPFGQLPMLDEGPLSLCQSQAILRYLARRLGLAGNTSVQQTRIDEITETALELLHSLSALFWDPAFAEKRHGHRDATHGRLRLLQTYFERIAPDDVHWALPDQFTVADATMAYALETALPLHEGLVSEFPALDRAMRAFFAADGVRQYVRSERRPRCWTVPMAAFGGKPEQTHQWY